MGSNYRKIKSIVANCGDQQDCTGTGIAAVGECGAAITGDL
jgi:hypothetical protein